MTATHKDESVGLGKVLKDELDEIREARKKRCQGRSDIGVERAPEPRNTGDAAAPSPKWWTDERCTEWRNAVAQAHKANLAGLAFSGGGIRSATFNLGVLQALADLKLLCRIDYLSTVSGGGYIGGWLAAWIQRVRNFADVQNGLTSKRVDKDENNEPRQIRFLRVFSNYLTPRLGLLSGDTLAVAAVILRNILLNLVVLLAALVALMLLPYAMLQGGVALRTAIAEHAVLLGAVFILLLLIALATIAVNMVYIELGQRSLWTRQGLVLCLAGVPLFVITILGALWQMSHIQAILSDTTTLLISQPFVFNQRLESTVFDSALYTALGYEATWLLATIGGLLAWRLQEKKAREDHGTDIASSQKEEEKKEKEEKEETPRTARGTLWMLLTALPAGGLAGWLYTVVSKQMVEASVQAELTFGVPLLLGIVLLTGTLHIGLMGKAFQDFRREWWARLGGWLLLGGIVWLVFFWLALYFPDFVQNNELVKASWKQIAAQYLTPAWIVTTFVGVFTAKGKDTSGKPETQNQWDLLVRLAPIVFIMGLLCWMSWGIAYFRIADSGLWWVLLGCAAIAAVVAWRVDVNQFSMHLLYQNRLVRCYLGASNVKRSPNRFTGFDENDDTALKDLTHLEGYEGPYPVLNAALNLVKGQDLAWQERKAASFVMTPLYCGYDIWLEGQDSPLLRLEKRPYLDQYAYRPTAEYASLPRQSKGLSLGTAMAISGAAANPNMGFYTSAPVAFLMTLFNVRLGQWLGNPRHIRTWKLSAPVWGLIYLLNELLARTTDGARFVQVSDGGHFENMGLYELVKRRCGLIIVCDAEEDGNYEYKGLGNAIQKCRIDMGIDIDLDVSDITPGRKGEPSTKHYAVGTIHYDHADLHAPKGTILYFKASLTGRESTDVQKYKKAHAKFPHESTVDQWFSESQFEAYRKLGYDAVSRSIHVPQKDQEPANEKLRKAFKDFGFDTPEIQPRDPTEPESAG